jgi:hypothetical protein
MKVPYNLQTTIPERDVGVNSQSGNAVIALPFPNPHNIAAKRGNVSLFRDQFFSNTISLKIITQTSQSYANRNPSNEQLPQWNRSNSDQPRCSPIAEKDQLFGHGPRFVDRYALFTRLVVLCYRIPTYRKHSIPVTPRKGNPLPISPSPPPTRSPAPL